MARMPSATRIADIAAAGAVCFGRLGYRRTRISEVAEEAGMSTGLVYSYVASKEALLHLVLAVSMGEPLPEQLPVPTPPLTDTLAVVEAGLRHQGRAPALKAAAESDPPADIRAELASIVSEYYDIVSRLRRALRVIESCAKDIPALDELYFGRRRRGQIDLLTRYIQRRTAEGRLATMPDPAIAARIVNESVAWFAWKRLEGHDATTFDDELAKRTVIEFACNALTGVPA